MSIDLISASVRNDASEDFILIVLDGNLSDRPTLTDFRKLLFRQSSQHFFKSIDAFGVYRRSKPVQSIYGGMSSHWWHVADGTKCSVGLTEAGQLEVTVHQHLPHKPLLTPSSPETWGYPAGALTG